jgi:2-C-methyl-D-erythritol 4-phosphate cytidylyltransferase
VKQAGSTVILLLAGRGLRAGGAVPKQYRPLLGRPLFLYSLNTFLRSSFISDIVMVIPEGDEAFCKEQIREAVREGFLPGTAGTEDCPERFPGKIRRMVPGGETRSESVLNGLRAIEWPCAEAWIHDGARPFITEEDLEKLSADVKLYGACLAANRMRDTVKISSADGFIRETLDRSTLWSVQTPQVFEYDLIRGAYEALFKKQDEELLRTMTDDAAVAGYFTGRPVRLTETSALNMKVTVPEDFELAQALLSRKIKTDKE